MNGNALKMKLLRPKLGVGTKTWLAFSVVFWMPILILVISLFVLFKDLLKTETLGNARIYLQSAEDIYAEKALSLKELFNSTTDSEEIRKSIKEANTGALHASLLKLAKNNPRITMLYYVDENFRIITNKKGKSGGILNIGNALPQSLATGQAVVTTELMSNQFLTDEDVELKKQIGNAVGLVQFVIHPIQENDKAIGAIVAGILLSGDPWLGNSVYNRYGVELAIFAGDRIESFSLHVFPSIPRNIWVPDQLIPDEIKNEIAFGKSFSGEIESKDGELVFAVFKPLRDSKERIIGTMGLSIPHSTAEGKILKPIISATIITAIIGFIISMIITLLVNHDITRPIKLLQEAMDALGNGDINTKLELVTGDEFERLGDGFNQMASGILQREERLRKHYEVTKLLMSTLDLEDLLHKMLKIVVEVTESQMGIVYLTDPSEKILKPRALYGTSSGNREISSQDGYPGVAISEKRHVLVRPSGTEAAEMINYGFAQSLPKELAYIPLVYNDSIMGLLVLGKVNYYSIEEEQLFDYLADQIAIALDNAILHQRVQDLSITDNLTGLNNRHFLNKRLDELWSKAQRHNEPLSMILTDIDNFKSINDTFGHKRGDEVLAEMGRILKECVRKEDLVARYGGEEFVVVMQNTTAEKAMELAERIRIEVENLKFDWAKMPIITSLGIVVFPESGAKDAVGLTHAADQAMYSSKTSGKNKTTIYSPDLH